MARVDKRTLWERSAADAQVDLWRAAAENSISAAVGALNAGADINLADDEGDTALMRAAKVDAYGGVGMGCVGVLALSG